MFNLKKKMIKKGKVFSVIIACVAILVVMISGSLFENTSRTRNYVCQSPISGKYTVWTDGGVKWQGGGIVSSYAKTSQIEFTSLEVKNNEYYATGETPAASLTFNDKGKGFIIGSFRVVLPTASIYMEKIQQDFGSERNLINNLIRPTLYKVITSCGPLMSSLESVSETRTDLIAYITDQLNNGVYKTRTKKVEGINEITGEKEVRTQAELIVDSLSPEGYKRQENSPFAQYGITCGLVSIVDIKYDNATQSQIDAQKAANLAVITAKTQAAKAMQDAITTEQKGIAAAAEAKWKQEAIKAVAVVQAEQEREVSRLAAEKARFDKEAIIAKGQAEAEANRLKVNAGLTPQERAEWEYKTTVGVAQALSESKVQWVPQVMMGGNNGSSNSALDAVGLKMLLDITKSIK